MRAALTSLILLSIFSVWSQRENVAIQRITEKVDINGELNEPFWDDCQVLSNFIQHTPLAGSAASRKTDVRLAYDNNALYISAELFDERDSMSLTLSERDEYGNADYFGLIFDPYDAGTIGFAFLVTSAGVQIDELHEVNNVDDNWNAVWQSNVTVKDDRWIAEIKIPFSALRFPKKPIQTWGLNFVRSIRRDREESYWNFYDPKGLNLISQLGVMNGIKDVDPPLRLSFTPYVSGYIENYDGNTGYTLNGGMDLKFGINNAFTLDMTLVPDFGQVQFDNQVLNLSPFEVRFNENRQFFTEGTELFNKQGLFYSRRVGGSPVNHRAVNASLDSSEIIVSNPPTTQLINASKLSGRTKKGTGIGVFNAVTSKMQAEIFDTESEETRLMETGPISNYNVFVIDQNLKNNSSITLTNTNVWRNGETYDANVTALGGTLYSSEQKFFTGASVAVSQIYEAGAVELGYKTNASLGKSSGNFLWQVNYSESNDTYNQNDLGFQSNNNVRSFYSQVDYNIYESFWKFYRIRSNFSVNYKQLVNPNEYSSFSMNLEANGTFRNFTTSGFWLDANPVKNHDWFEPRTIGRFYETDESFGGGAFISTDYSKRFALDVNGSFTKYNEDQRYESQIYVSPRLRVNDHLNLIYDYSLSYANNDEGAALTRTFRVPHIGEDPVFARRNRLTAVNKVTAAYIFTNRMGLTFGLRHYWSKVDYNEFFVLNLVGQFNETSYTGLDADEVSLHDNSFNAFTIDMVYRWVFAPGSELSLVWKNSIFSSSEVVTTTYFENLSGLGDFPATNSFSLKLLYYIDTWEMKSKIRT
ncbi:MAG: hypothetical protein GQ574_06575 [Crocinitomix sp.]|nr:hypothetical protein [Crocinitomix sp.]